MIEFNSIEEIDHIFEKLKTDDCEKSAKAIDELKRLFILKVEIKEDKTKNQIIESLQHELAELEEENDAMTQELSLSRKSLCKDLEKTYKEKHNKYQISQNLEIYKHTRLPNNLEINSSYNKNEEAIMKIVGEIESEKNKMEDLEILMSNMEKNKNNKDKTSYDVAINYFNKEHFL